MNLREYLLQCLAEEGNEIAQETSKALRFGLEDVNVKEPDGPPNVARVCAELNDLLGTVAVLVDKGILPVNWRDAKAQDLKRRKLATFVGYAATKDTLDLSSEPTPEFHSFKGWWAQFLTSAKVWGFGADEFAKSEHWRECYETGQNPEHALFEYLEANRAARAKAGR